MPFTFCRVRCFDDLDLVLALGSNLQTTSKVRAHICFQETQIYIFQELMFFMWWSSVKLSFMKKILVIGIVIQSLTRPHFRCDTIQFASAQLKSDRLTGRIQSTGIDLRFVNKIHFRCQKSWSVWISLTLQDGTVCRMLTCAFVSQEISQREGWTDKMGNSVFCRRLRYLSQLHPLDSVVHLLSCLTCHISRSNVLST